MQRLKDLKKKKKVITIMGTNVNSVMNLQQQFNLYMKATFFEKACYFILGGKRNYFQLSPTFLYLRDRITERRNIARKTAVCVGFFA